MNFSGKTPVICGPTGSGKTAIALEIAEKLPIEIVSADSGQMIRRLDIGTAKPTKREQQQVRFHLIDIINPGDNYTAFKFIDDADRAISEIIERNKIPVIVGGTGLYLKALSEGVFEIEAPNAEVRARLEDEMDKFGARAMYDRLKNVDPQEAANVHLNNKMRITRALEIYYLTGEPKSELIKSGRHKKSVHSIEYFCLLPEREKLYRIIERRIDKMLEQGFLEEINRLKKAGLEEPVQKMNVIGYNELLEHINGNTTFEKAVLLIKQNSRRYAKRQVTWFKHQIDGNYFSTPKELKNAVIEAYSGFLR